MKIVENEQKRREPERELESSIDFYRLISHLFISIDSLVITISASTF